MLVVLLLILLLLVLLFSCKFLAGSLEHTKCHSCKNGEDACYDREVEEYVETHQIFNYGDDRYIILEGSELSCCPVRDEDDMYFYAPPRRTPEEYKQLILDSQQYFEDILSGGVDIGDPDVYIYQKRTNLSKYVKEIIYHETNINENVVHAFNVYVRNSVRVIHGPHGYLCGDNGRHRYVAARELKNVKLLVKLVS